MFWAIVSRVALQRDRADARRRLDGPEQLALPAGVVGDVHAGEARAVHQLVERIQMHVGGEAEVAPDHLRHGHEAHAAPPFEHLDLHHVAGAQVQDLGDPLVDHEAGARQRDWLEIEIEHAREVHGVGLADDRELPRVLPVAQPHRHGPVGLGAQDTGHVLHRLQGAGMLLVGEVEGRLLPLRPEEGHIDHQLDRVE